MSNIFENPQEGVYRLRSYSGTPHCNTHVVFMKKDANGNLLRDGTSIDDVLKMISHYLESFDGGPEDCTENKEAVYYVSMALECMRARRQRRREEAKTTTGALNFQCLSMQTAMPEGQYYDTLHLLEHTAARIEQWLSLLSQICNPTWKR